MRSLDVDARNDDTRPEGGHAVLLFAGLEPPVGPVRFVLRPLDTHVDPDRLEELSEPQDAVAVQAVEGGCEIVLGPQTTAHLALETGSVVEIELVGLEVRSQFVWPAVPPLTRPKRAGLQIKKLGTVRPVVSSGTDTRAPRTQPMMMRPAGAGSAASTAAASTDAASLGAAAGAVTPAVMRTGAAKPAVSADEPPTPALRSELRVREAVGSETGKDDADYVVFYPHARGGNLKRSTVVGGRQRPSLLPSTPGGAALSTAVVVLGLVGLLSLGNSAHKPVVVGAAVTQSTVSAGAPSSPRGQADAPNEASLFELLSPGATSPRGTAAKDVTPQKALELAQAAFLTPGAPRDAEEGSFWLRRYVASIGNDERTRRALTQLGSAYADSANKSFDFGKARQVWELASAFGDPVAMCFLGVLHENGLAGPVDRKASLAWFERAKLAGGCPGLDDAVARVKP